MSVPAHGPNCPKCESVSIVDLCENNAVWYYCDHCEHIWHDPNNPYEKALRAVAYVERFGIWARPVYRGSDRYWEPHQNSGVLSQVVHKAPTLSGWPTFADAVIALGEYLEEKENA